MPPCAAPAPSKPSSAPGGGSATRRDEIERAAGLRPGARQPRAAERLHADGRADDVAVDVDVAGLDALDDARDRLVDPGVQAEGEAVAGGVDLVDQRVEVAAPVAQHMQHRPEHFALDVGDAWPTSISVGATKVPRSAVRPERRLRDVEAARPHRLDMGR